jgi:regulator of protease activity HflC (stomatin/prohibitin superfamily)
MYKLSSIILMMIILVFGCSCSRVNVDLGHEAVLIYKPWFFGHGGVEKDPVKPGSVFVALSTDSYELDMRPIKFDEPFDDIMPKDNNPVDYHASVRLQITDSVGLLSKFGTDYYKNNIQRAFQTMNRNQVRQYSMPELALQQEVVEKVERELEKELQEYVDRFKIPVKILDISLGKISPQKEIIAAYNETGVQQQRAKTEAQRANAEESRKAAEIKRAEADRAYQEARGLTPDQYLKMLQIEACSKSNCTMIMGSNAVPMVNVK